MILTNMSFDASRAMAAASNIALGTVIPIPVKGGRVKPPSVKPLGFLRAITLAFSSLAGCARPVPETPQVATAQSQPIFEDVTELAGISFQHRAGGAEKYFFPAIMCAGGAFLDFDADGDLDILLVDGGEGPRTTDVPNSSQESRPSRGDGKTQCRLFRQDEGLKFHDVSETARLNLLGYGMGAAVGDINNDGYPDIYVTCFGPDHLFLNRRDGTFQDQTHSANIENERWGASATFFDYDRDGWLDLFVTNYVDYDLAQACLIHNGQQDFCNPAMFARTSDKLFRNVTGQAHSSAETAAAEFALVRFEDVSVASGIAMKAGAGLGVISADLNSDGWPDIYVANDGHGNFLWLNQRDGTFRDEAVLSGVAYDRLGKGQGSMGIALGDVNHDLRLDLLVTNLDGESNALYLGLAEGGFEESSVNARISTVSFPRTGFGTALVDIEHDGDLDLLVANGRVRRRADNAAVTNRSRSAEEFWWPYRESNDLLLNDGAGRFDPVASKSDGFLSMPGPSRALATGDVDNDGDFDLLVTMVDGPARLLLNVGAKSGHWLIVRAVLPDSGGRDALGARVTVMRGERRWGSVVAPGASYLSSQDPRLHFGLGEASQVDAIEVLWPDGRSERFAGGAADRQIVVEQGRGDPK